MFLHDGATMRRVRVSSKLQIAGATTGALTLMFSTLGIVQLAIGTPAMASAVGSALSRDAAVARMNAKVAAVETELKTIRRQAVAHADRLDARLAMLDAVVTGAGKMPASVPAKEAISQQLGAVIAPLTQTEVLQDAMAVRVAAATDARYHATKGALGRLGIDAGRFHRGAMGGPYEPVPTASDAPVATKRQADPAFRALFQSWKRLEQLQTGIVAIPSQRPVDAVSFTSGFGVRSDPFRGGAAMHAGVDISGPIGTPIYATADGIVGRAQWANGYGKLIEIEHGKGIQTRYGHLSGILVAAGARVTRGQLIGRMGSTGRSTGSHLHYEVRLDGHAVNPMPFLQSATYLVAMQNRARGAAVAMGGPRGE